MGHEEDVNRSSEKLLLTLNRRVTFGLHFRDRESQEAGTWLWGVAIAQTGCDGSLRGQSQGMERMGWGAVSEDGEKGISGDGEDVRALETLRKENGQSRSRVEEGRAFSDFSVAPLSPAALTQLPHVQGAGSTAMVLLSAAL